MRKRELRTGVVYGYSAEPGDSEPRHVRPVMLLDTRTYKLSSTGRLVDAFGMSPRGGASWGSRYAVGFPAVRLRDVSRAREAVEMASMDGFQVLSSPPVNDGALFTYFLVTSTRFLRGLYGECVAREAALEEARVAEVAAAEAREEADRAVFECLAGRLDVLGVEAVAGTSGSRKGVFLSFEDADRLILRAESRGEQDGE